MRHYKLNTVIRTILDKDFKNIEELKKDEKKLSDAVDEAYKTCLVKENSNNSQNRRRNFIPSMRRSMNEGSLSLFKNSIDFYIGKYGDLVKEINNILLPLCNENESLIVEGMSTREIIFVLKFSNDLDGEEKINNAKKTIEHLVEERMSEILHENEHYLDCHINVQEIASTEFYFTVLNEAEEFGLDIDEYMKKIKEYKYGSDFDRFNRSSDYVMEFEIEKKLTYDEFLDKYKKLLYNRNFYDEIRRIYVSKNIYNVKINPVHYEFTQYNADDRIEMFKALTTALYSNNRIISKKVIKIKIDIICNYANNNTLNIIFENSKGSMVFIEFEVDHGKHAFTNKQYWGCTEIRTKELTDNILSLKDDVQFAFYIDKYQDKVRSGIYDELAIMNIVKFEDKLIPEKANEYVEGLAIESKVEVNDDLKNRVKLYKEDINKEEAKIIFEDYKDDIIKNKYFPEYKDYYENKGGIDNIKDPYAELMAMPGLYNIKKLVNDVINIHELNEKKKERFLEYQDKGKITGRFNGNTIPLHMVFMGNPGTCKTTVAKMIAKIFKSRGIIKNDRTEFFGIEGRCFHLENAFKYAYGGILFIDEAYDLLDVTELVALMENHRDDVIVIFAGYTDKMREFFNLNEGLRSRISYILEFNDYNENELFQIFEKMLKDEELNITVEAKDAVKNILGEAMKVKDYGNGRYIRKLLENARLNMDLRLSKLNKNEYTIDELKTLEVDDFKNILSDKILDDKTSLMGFVA